MVEDSCTYMKEGSEEDEEEGSEEDKEEENEHQGGRVSDMIQYRKLYVT